MGYFLFEKLMNVLSPTLSAKEVNDVNLPDLNPPEPTKANSIYDFTVVDINGKKVNLSEFKGLVTYIVNVASK